MVNTLLPFFAFLEANLEVFRGSPTGGHGFLGRPIEIAGLGEFLVVSVSEGLFLSEPDFVVAFGGRRVDFCGLWPWFYTDVFLIRPRAGIG